MSDHPLQFQESREFSLFIPLIQALSGELGAAFAPSIEAWCGRLQRDYPLEDWHVFLAFQESCCIGLCSHYRQPEDAEQRLWAGWIGVLPEFRRRGMGSLLLDHVEFIARTEGDRALWVYTDSSSAMQFYRANGFIHVGRFGVEKDLPQHAATDASEVFRKTW